VKAELKRRMKEEMRGRPGHRFQDRYERAKRKKGGSRFRRVLNIALAVVLAAVGVVLVFIPGPAVVFFFLAGGFAASESRLVARAMDWLEVKVRAIVSWSRRRWTRMHRRGRAALIGAGACVSIAGSYAGWWLVRN
jgi:hypothetical protein